MKTLILAAAMLAAVAASAFAQQAPKTPANASNVLYAIDGSVLGQDPDLFRQTEPPLVLRGEGSD